MAQTLTESLDIAEVGDRIVQGALPIFSVQSSGLRLRQPDGSLLAIAWGGPAPAHFALGHVLPSGTGLVGRVITESQPIWTQDQLNEPARVLTDDLCRRIGNSGNRALLTVPLRVKGGALACSAFPIRPYAPSHRPR